MEKKAHARLGASTSDIWTNCPGAPNLWDKAPEKMESAYAEEGTKAHELLEVWARHIRDGMGAMRFPKGLQGPEFREPVRVAIDYINSKWKKGSPKELVIEERVELPSEIGPDMFGTVDLGLVEHFGELEAADYKHGRGVRVEVFKETAQGEKRLNTQLAYYALALAHKYHFNFDRVTLTIIQPRFQGASPISTVTVPSRQVMGFIDFFKRAVDETGKRNAKRHAGPWCRFCRAKPICKEGQGKYRTDSRNDF